MATDLGKGGTQSLRRQPPCHRWLAGGSFAIVVVAVLLCLTGCDSRASRVAGVDVDVDQVCGQLMKELDGDGSGSLSMSELDAVPALIDPLSRLDEDDDRHISRKELQTGFADVFTPTAGLVRATCLVTRHGRPLTGATVRLVPAPFLRDRIPLATGVTGTNGQAVLSIAPEDLPTGAPQVEGLVRPGLYFVEVTHPELAIPKTYNAETQLGTFVPQTGRNRSRGPIAVELDF